MTLLLKHRGIWYGEPIGLFRVRVSGKNSGNLPMPPAVVVMRDRPIWSTSTIRTRMSLNGWDYYLKKLNGDKFKAAVNRRLAMFNGRDSWPENDRMESLLFAGNLVRAVPSGVYRWYRIITLDYRLGPPHHMPTFDEDPISVQEFTVVSNKTGKLFTREVRLFYPVVTAKPVYMHEDQLEHVSLDMETKMPKP